MRQGVRKNLVHHEREVRGTRGGKDQPGSLNLPVQGKSCRQHIGGKEGEHSFRRRMHVDFLHRTFREKLVRPCHREDPPYTLLQGGAHFVRCAPSRLHAQEARDGLKIVLHTMVDFLDDGRLHTKLALLLAQLRHILQEADAPQLRAPLCERHIAHEERAPARLELLLLRLACAHAFASDLGAETAVEELHADEAADAEHAIEMKRRRIGKDDAIEAVGDENRRAGRERRKKALGLCFLRLPYDILCRFDEMGEGRFRPPFAVDHERDRSDGGRTVRDGEGEHFKALAEADFAPAPLQAALLQSRTHERLFGARDGCPRARKLRRIRKSGGLRQEARGDEEAPLLQRGQVERQLRTENVGAEGECTADAAQELRLHRRQRRMLPRRGCEFCSGIRVLHAPATSTRESPGTAFRERSA